MLHGILYNLLSVLNNSGGHLSVVLLLCAFLGGIISSLSPCTIGVLPLIMSYIIGYGKETPKRTFIQMLSFTFGLSCVMSLTGVLCLVFGRTMTAIGGDIWILIIASLLVVLGLNLLGVLDIQFPQIVRQMPFKNTSGLFIFPFLIGIFYALASTPCSTPILVGIMGFASITKRLSEAVLLMFLFALGQGVIIILAGVFTSFLKNAKKFMKINEILVKLAGVILIFFGFMIYYKIFSSLF